MPPKCCSVSLKCRPLRTRASAGQSRFSRAQPAIAMCMRCAREANALKHASRTRHGDVFGVRELCFVRESELCWGAPVPGVLSTLLELLLV